MEIVIKTNKTPYIPKKPFEIQQEIFDKTKAYHKFVPDNFKDNIISFLPQYPKDGTITDKMVFTFEERNLIFSNKLTFLYK